MRALRTLAAEYTPVGREIPLYQGEWGYSSGAGATPLITVEQHAKLVARIYLVSMLVSDPMSILYTWQVWPQDLARRRSSPVCIKQLELTPPWCSAGLRPRLLRGRAGPDAAHQERKLRPQARLLRYGCAQARPGQRHPRGTAPDLPRRLGRQRRVRSGVRRAACRRRQSDDLRRLEHVDVSSRHQAARRARVLRDLRHDGRADRKDLR